MDEMIKRLTEQGTTGEGIFSTPEFLTSLTVALICCGIFAYVYRTTHRGLSYSVSYVHTLFIMGVTTSVIMLIIGSNIARAFSLVGALSIIRFRNAVKETRDVGFLFMCMAAGMAAGTGFYWAAILFTLFSSAMMYGLTRFEVGVKVGQEMILTVHLPEGIDHESAFSDCFRRSFESYSLLSLESIRGGTLLELVYSVNPKKGVVATDVMAEIRQLNQNHKVSLLVGRDIANV